MPNPTNPSEAEDAERELKKLVYDYFNDDLLLVCDRVWEAWHVGTMTEDDFSRIDEDDYVLPELVRRLSAFVEAQKQKWVAEVESKLDATIDKFSIHTPKGIAKGTLARKSLKKQVRAALRGEK